MFYKRLYLDSERRSVGTLDCVTKLRITKEQEVSILVTYKRNHAQPNMIRPNCNKHSTAPDKIILVTHRSHHVIPSTKPTYAPR